MVEVPGPLAADFRRFYGHSIPELRSDGLPLQEVAAMAVFLPLESMTHRTVNPHWQRTPELDLLRDLEHDARVLAWQNGPRRRSDYPEPHRLPWDPEPEGAMKGDRMTTDDWDKHLGWDRLKAEGA